MGINNHELLREDFSLKQAEKVQIKYSYILRKQEIENIKLLDKINNIVGVDISYFKKENEEYGVSCAVLWNISDKKVKKIVFANGQIKFPYYPGFLGFRECNLLARAIERLSGKPDLIICDGHGIIHPKKFGEAVQLGLALDIPSIGIAKNPFIGYCKWKQLKRKKGNKEPILAFKPGSMKNSKPEVLGFAICLNDNMKPVFISIGYKTTLDLAIKVALKTSLSHRQPEPLYLADHFSKQKINEILSC